MATITITGTTATETLTGSATMTDTEFANVLAAYKIIGPHPGLSTAQIQGLTDAQMWTLLCSQFLGQI